LLNMFRATMCPSAGAVDRRQKIKRLNVKFHENPFICLAFVVYIHTDRQTSRSSYIHFIFSSWTMQNLILSLEYELLPLASRHSFRFDASSPVQLRQVLKAYQSPLHPIRVALPPSCAHSTLTQCIVWLNRQSQRPSSLRRSWLVLTTEIRPIGCDAGTEGLYILIWPRTPI